MPEVKVNASLQIRIAPWVPAFLRVVALLVRLRVPLPEKALERFLVTYGWSAKTTIRSAA